MENFNPRSPHGERLHGVERTCEWCRISIHAPRMGSDPEDMRRQARLRYFNPRSPHGERPVPDPLERDWSYFNPRSPHGERPDREI